MGCPRPWRTCWPWPRLQDARPRRRYSRDGGVGAEGARGERPAPCRVPPDAPEARIPGSTHAQPKGMDTWLTLVPARRPCRLAARSWWTAPCWSGPRSLSTRFTRRSRGPSKATGLSNSEVGKQRAGSTRPARPAPSGKHAVDEACRAGCHNMAHLHGECCCPARAAQLTVGRLQR